jgi:membrane-bound ClpP family serine protease
VIDWGVDDWIIWLVVGLALIIAEALAPGVYLMWIGLAAVGTGLVVLGFGFSFGLSVVVFAILAAVSLAAGLRLRRPVTRLNTQNGRAVVSWAGRTRPHGRQRLGRTGAGRHRGTGGGHTATSGRRGRHGADRTARGNRTIAVLGRVPGDFPNRDTGDRHHARCRGIGAIRRLVHLPRRGPPPGVPPAPPR